VSIIFLTVVSYIIGEAMATVIPKTGFIGRWFNPHDFNSKEHLAIVIMSGSASGAAYATEVLATQKLYYNVIPNPIIAILLLFSSQLLGYGMAGVLRKSLVYPTKMLWPGVLPLNSLIETLHRNRSEMKKRWNFFWIIFGAVTVWELFPQYVMPVLTGVSVFCLANRNSLVFTNLFGGSNGNEGLGILSLSFDFQYIGTSALVSPLVTQLNGFVGYILCIILFVTLYYGNVWDAQKYPFLAQQLFSGNSTSELFEIYNQTAILDANSELDPAALATQGLPFFSATNASYLLTTNLGITATVVHVFLWNRDAIKNSVTVDFSKLRSYVSNPGLIWKKQPKQAMSEEELDQLDPHYRKMLAYDEVPNFWYLGVLVVSIIVALVCIYALDSTLPWWGFLIATLLSFLGTLFFGALSGVIGFTVPITNVIQLIGGYLHPGKPVANMYFVLFGANAQAQALGLVGNLKLGQYGKLSPKCNFGVQILGTLLGAVVNYALMSSITTQQRDILLSIQGTNIVSKFHL
jgi:OPT family oligopeptide transporter